MVKLFTAALIVFSLWRLSFTFIGQSEEKKVQAIVENQLAALHPEASQDEKDALRNSIYRRVEDSMKNINVIDFLGLKYTYQEVKEKELQLGLDLQGGMSVTLEVGLDGLIQSMSKNPKDPMLKAALEEAEKMRVNSDADFVTLFGQAFKKLNPSTPLAPLFTKPSQQKITLNSTDEQVLAIIKEESKGAIERTHKILSTRIDKFGVTQPSINLDANRGVITVELAGVKDPESVRKYLQSTAKLQFWEVASNASMINNVMKANESIQSYLKAQKESTKSTNTENTEATTESTSNDTMAVANNADTTTNAEKSTEGSLADLLNSEGSGALNQTGDSAEAQDESLFTYMMPMVSEQGQVTQSPNIGICAAKDADKVIELLNLSVAKKYFPSNIKFLRGDAGNGNKSIVAIYAIKTLSGRDEAKLEGDRVVDARFDYDPMTNQPMVSLKMDQQGAAIWAKMTRENVGNFIAISLDDYVYTAPTVNGEIPGGNSQIQGGFTPKEGTDLANILKTGKLPAPAKIVQEQVVGPTLGQESIDGATNAFIISFLAIFILMLLYYNSAGMVANIALVLNVIFTFAVFANLGGTLTMAGIAGIILGIGMAVDANVIIFERIKEELMLGESHAEAVRKGYVHSLNPIIDGHVTSLITAFVLLYFGLGPIRGFATTQIIALILSLFTGIMVSRLITDMYMKNGKRHFKYFTGFSKGIFQKAKFKFIENRKIGYGISVVLIVLGLASFFNGFHYGVEFSGGRKFIVQLDEKRQVSEIREKLGKHLDNSPIVKTLGQQGNMVEITTDYLIETPGAEVRNKVVAKLYEGMKAESLIPAGVDLTTFDSKYIQGEQTVLPIISEDLKDGAKWATGISILLICLYIFIRFNKVQYSVGTIISLAHDALATLAVFSFFKNIVPFSLEIDQHFIAALLTVIGFSMNDTVIVYDRAREYFRKEPNGDRIEILNKAINSTLTRTLMTSLTLFLTALILFIFGGDVLRGFAFAMSIGVLVATYSSIFVAAPLLIDLDKKDSLRNEENKDERIRLLKEEA